MSANKKRRPQLAQFLIFAVTHAEIITALIEASLKASARGG
jgi:hypothetical protein